MNTLDKIAVYTTLGLTLYGIFGVELPNEKEYKQKQLEKLKIDATISEHAKLINKPQAVLISKTDTVNQELNKKILKEINSDKKVNEVKVLSSSEFQFNQRIQNKLDSMNIPTDSKFRYILRINSKRNLKLEDGNYSIHRKDKGNYNRKGQLVGTNRSVAAKTYETYLRRKYKDNSISVSKQEMMNLSIEEAIEIYHYIYLNGILGDEMMCNKSILVDMIFNAYCNAPASCINAYNRCIRTLIHKTNYSIRYGEDVLKSKLKTEGINKDNIELFNYICNDIQLEREFYKMFLELKMNSFKRNPQVKTFKGWLKWGKDYPISHYN